MNDIQILTLALSICTPLGLLLLNNSRMSDMRTDVDRRMSDFQSAVQSQVTAQSEMLRAEIRASEASIRADLGGRIDRLDAKLEAILKILADHDASLRK